MVFGAIVVVYTLLAKWREFTIHVEHVIVGLL
jgi:hypothetical protein